MAEFVLLWEKVQEVHFTDNPDQIVWKWTANGMYSSKSVYMYNLLEPTALLIAQRFGRSRLKASAGFFFCMVTSASEATNYRQLVAEIIITKVKSLKSIFTPQQDPMIEDIC